MYNPRDKGNLVLLLGQINISLFSCYALWERCISSRGTQYTQTVLHYKPKKINNHKNLHPTLLSWTSELFLLNLTLKKSNFSHFSCSTTTKAFPSGRCILSGPTCKGHHRPLTPSHAAPLCPRCHPLTSLSRLVPAAVVGLSSGL